MIYRTHLCRFLGWPIVGSTSLLNSIRVPWLVQKLGIKLGKCQRLQGIQWVNWQQLGDLHMYVIFPYTNDKQRWTTLILKTAFVTPLGQCNAYVTCLVAQSAEELKESASNRAATWLRNYAAYEQSELLQAQQPLFFRWKNDSADISTGHTFVSIWQIKWEHPKWWQI